MLRMFMQKAIEFYGRITLKDPHWIFWFSLHIQGKLVLANNKSRKNPTAVSNILPKTSPTGQTLISILPIDPTARSMFETTITSPCKTILIIEVSFDKFELRIDFIFKE